MTTMSGLEGKSVVVTGGASGIGRAAVEILLRNGASVTVGGRDEASGEALLAALGDWGDRIQFILTDVASEEQTRRLVDRAGERFGGVHAAINSAGVPPRGVPIHELSTEQWMHAQQTNLTGMFFSIKYQMLAMIATGQGGSIVAISSTAAVGALPGSAEYVASKAGANGLVRAAALDGAPHGVRVNGIMPGAIKTPMFDASLEDNADFEPILAAIPLRRIGVPEEAAAGAVWLVSDQSSYVTGAVFPIDGGISAD